MTGGTLIGMDANKPRENVLVNIAGRQVKMARPTDGQILGLQMLQSGKLSDGARLEGLSELFLSLLPTDGDRAWFVMQFANGAYSLNDFTLSLKAIATAPAVLDDEERPVTRKPVKRAAKKTAARR